MLFYLVISILILCLLFILFLPNLTAYLLCYILPSLSPSLTLLEISSFSCLPLSCSHFLAHVLFHTTLISVSFESCRVEINLLQPGRGLFLIDIHRLHISVENLQFSDAMASSVSPTEESSSSKLRKFILKLISISIREISFDVKVAKADQLLVSGSARDFIIVTSSSSSQDSSYVLIEVNIREGELTFAQLGSVFCAYSNEKSVISVDYQVFSRKMIVMGALKGLNRVKVDLEPFIQFYHRFQLEEDDALERKMLITDRLDGKMTFMSVKVDKMSVNLTDNRVPEPLDFELISFAMSIAMHRIPDSPNRNKCITVSLGMARWFHCDAVVMNLQAKKQLFVMNEKDFIDVEIAEGHCDKVSFVSLPSFFLKWLCILSDVNDCLPSSRFAHTKQSTLNVNIAHFLLSYCPISSDPSDSQEEEEESLVCFEHQKLKVRKRSEAYQNESHYSITSQSFQLRSTLSFAELQRRCSLVLAKDESRVPFSGAGSCGTLWIFDEFQATCISGVSFLFKSIKSTSFRVLNVSTLTSSQSIFLQMDPLNASWSSEHQVQVILGEILMTVSVEYLTIFNITFGFINRAVERLLGFLRSMKELKYGPVLRPQSPSLEVKVDSSGLNVQFLTSLPSESSIRFVASSLQYSSLEGRSTYVMLQSRLRLQLSETLSHEVITFEKICYCSHASLASSRRINHSFMTLKTCRFFLLPYASLGTLLSQLGSFSEAVSLSQLLPGEQVQVIPTVYKLELDSFEVLFCQETPEQSPSSSSSLSVKCAAVSRLRLLDISVEHDCSDSNSIVQNDIAKLDQVPGIHYSSPSGGKLRLQCDSIRMFTESAGLEYFLLEKTSVTGVLYSASVEDDRLPTFEVRKTWLPLHSSMLASLNQGIASAGVYKREHNAPSKTYGNLFLTLDKVRVGINPAVALCVNESVEIAGKAFGDDEKKKDNCNSAPPPQIPLSMWDSIRYWYHGSISFLLGSVVVKVISEIKNEDVVPEVASNNLLTRQNSLKTLNKKQIQLVIQLQQVRLTLAYTAIELRAYSLVFNLRHRIRERLENIDLLHMPGIVFTVSFSHQEASSLQYTHHDVYLRPVDDDAMDPYLLFRTAPASVKCAMLLRCSGRVDQPVLLILRLDLLKLLLETRTSNANVEEDEKEVKSKAAKETEHPSLIDLVAVLDLQIHIEQMQLCSWPSYQNRKGFVFCQEKLDLQLKLIRAGAGESSSPQVHNALYSEYNGIIVDRLRTEIQQVAVYFRDWVTKRRRPSRGLQDDSLDGGGGVYLRDLMDALYRVFYASTVKVSYLEQNAEDEEELRTKPRSRSPLGDSASKQRSPPSSLYRSEAFKPQLTTFEANHLHFVPPVKTMPRSSQVWRSSIEGDDFPKYCGTPAKRLSISQSQRRLSYNSASIQPKIWSLKMIDTRLLWSVFLRDAIFHYFITYFDVFDAEDKSRTSATAKPPQSSMVPQTSFNYSTPNSKTTALNSDRSHEKASLADFLREEKQRIPMGLLAQIKTPRRLGGDELQVPHDEEECLLPAVSTDDAGVAALERVSGGGGSRRGPSRALYRVVQDTSMQSHFLSNLKKGNTTFGGLSSRKRPQSPREIRRTRSGLGQPSRSIRGPLFSRLTEKEKDQLETESRCSGVSPDGMSQKEDSKVDDALCKPGAVGEFICYFKIVLVDPQLNFLDSKSRGSLICSTDRSSLVGRHFSSATIGAAVDGDPKRKHEIKLRMSNVSAYTASTQLGEGEDVVHWKTVDGDNANINGRKKINLNSNRALKLAIENFQIRCAYTFYTDITVKEAKTMKVYPSNTDLVCLCKVDLPNLVADIESDQFYIMLNVVRNVLLSPPPVSAAAEKRRKERDGKEEEKSKRMQIHRRADLLQRYDRRALPVLDLNTKASRDEIKVLIEETIKEPLEIEEDIARYVECFVGKGKWILRSSDDGRALLEFGFTGVFATYSFHDDRSTVALFDVQRFWARSFHSSADTRTVPVLDDKSFILVPVLPEYEFCYRCESAFKTIENNAHSCGYHADGDDVDGVFQEVKLRTSNGLGEEVETKIMAWSCCGRTTEDAPRCRFRPHVCRENMLSIRAESYPSSFIENIDLNILQSLEISIFPGASYDLRVRITRSLTDILHSYFSVDAPETVVVPPEPPLAANALNQSDGANDIGYFSLRSNAIRQDSALLPSTPVKSNSGGHLVPTNSYSSSKPSRRRSSNFLMQSRDNQDSSSASNKLTSTVAAPKQEGIYFKYLRVGDINVDVSTSGFAFNVDNYKAVVQPFLRRGEVMTWSKFIWELEQHAAWSLTFNNAAKQINRLGRIFSFGNVALSGEQKEQLVMDESSHGVEDPNVELLLGKLPGVKKNNEK